MYKQNNLITRYWLAVVVILALLGPLSVCAEAIVGWGRNTFGQCDAPSGNDFIAIAAGTAHSLALKADGSIVAWGSNGFGRTNVPLGNDFTHITAGATHNVVLKANGSIVAWGDNTFGQTEVPTGNNFIDIATGYYHSFALKSDGSLVAWGHGNSSGGYDNVGQYDVPVGYNFTDIAAGYYHSLALKSDGSLVAWGDGSHGQKNVPAGNDFVNIAAGGWHNLALKSDGSIVAWGDNTYGQLNVPSGHFIDIDAGYFFSLALKSDGSIVAWGDNAYGQLNVPSDHFIIDIDAGFGHGLALTREPVTLTITVEPNNVGIDTVTPDVGTHGCGGWISIKAERFVNCPDVYTFDHWDGDANDPNSADTTVFMDLDKTITAVFVDGRQCGDECHPYPSVDVNKDCKVDLLDIAMVASSWLECTRPECD
jgi:hypothetical protein